MALDTSVGVDHGREAGIGGALVVGLPLAGENPVEVERPARGGDVLEIVAQRGAQISAELELMPTHGPGQSVGELVLLRDLVLGQKVRRADKRVHIGEGDHGDAAIESGIRRHAGNVVRGVV